MESFPKAQPEMEFPHSGILQYLERFPGAHGVRVALLASQLAACSAMPKHHSEAQLLEDLPDNLTHTLEQHGIPSAIDDLCDVSYDPDRVQYPTLHIRQFHGQPTQPLDEFRTMIEEHGLDPNVYLRGIQESQETINTLITRLSESTGEPVPVYFEGEIESSASHYARKREELVEIQEHLAAIPNQPAGIEQLSDLWSTLKEDPDYINGQLADPVPVRTAELIYAKIKELSSSLGEEGHYLSATHRRLLDELRTDFTGPDAPFSKYLLNATEKAYYNHSGAYAAFMDGQAVMLPGDSYQLLTQVVAATNRTAPERPRYGNTEEITAYQEQLQKSGRVCTKTRKRLATSGFWIALPQTIYPSPLLSMEPTIRLTTSLSPVHPEPSFDPPTYNTMFAILSVTQRAGA